MYSLTYVLISTIIFGKLSLSYVKKLPVRKACSRRRMRVRFLIFGCINNGATVVFPDVFAVLPEFAACFIILSSLQIFIWKYSDCHIRRLIADL